MPWTEILITGVKNGVKIQIICIFNTAFNFRKIVDFQNSFTIFLLYYKLFLPGEGEDTHRHEHH